MSGYFILNIEMLIGTFDLHLWGLHLPAWIFEKYWSFSSTLTEGGHVISSRLSINPNLWFTQEDTLFTMQKCNTNEGVKCKGATVLPVQMCDIVCTDKLVNRSEPNNYN